MPLRIFVPHTNFSGIFPSESGCSEEGLDTSLIFFFKYYFHKYNNNVWKENKGTLWLYMTCTTRLISLNKKHFV